MTGSLGLAEEIAPPVVFDVCEPESGLEGWIAIDSLIDNHCHGGVRALPDVTAGELRLLAAAMTQKFGFLGLPHGGAKAGLRCPVDLPATEKRRLLGAFACRAAWLLRSRVFRPGHDMGTSEEEIRVMLGDCGLEVPRHGHRSSGWYTALTVVAAARAAAAHLGTSLADCRVAIEGLGDVGGAVAMELDAVGCKIVAVSTRQGALYAAGGLPIASIVRQARRIGDTITRHCDTGEQMAKEELLELDVDLLVPCARHHCITRGNAPRVRARCICAGANRPLTEEAEQSLTRRGVLVVPDFISSSGGVLGGSMEFAGLGPAVIRRFIRSEFEAQVSAILRRATAQGTAPRQVAEQVTRSRLERLHARSRRRPVRRAFFWSLVELVRRRLAPQRVVAPVAAWYFRRRIRGAF